MPYYKKKKAHAPYVPKLLPPQLAPEAITWGLADPIIQFLKEGKSIEEIAALTGNRLSFVKRVVNRHLHPDEYEIPTPVLEPKPEIIEAPKSVKVLRQPKQKKSHVCYACGTNEARQWFNNGGIGSICVSCLGWIKKLARDKKPRILLTPEERKRRDEESRQRWRDRHPEKKVIYAKRAYAKRMERFRALPIDQQRAIRDKENAYLQSWRARRRPDQC